MGSALKKRIQQAKFPSPAVEAMFNVIVAADYLRNRADAVCAQFGITSSQYNVLRIIRGSGDRGRSRAEIADRLLDRAPDVTRLIDRLEAQEFAERDRSTDDKRLSITRITQKGRKLIADIEPEMITIEKFLNKRLSKGDLKRLSSLCEEIYGA